ncbi:MAG: bifunctional phosphoribosylaminoimidazolecarboxamide formyltransferase/IMP cyclohydrolase [Herpetosiphonaceae bacterium]|nr:bifunctional phosphoribosylaminoimidazolecarboxamide formyltransferase/IMP cyclohydrolase [Herpetosiphonaceae bacterium]
MRAIMSVFDKRDVVRLGRGLHDVGVEIFSTGGTLRALEVGGVAAQSISVLTGFPEILDGRIKTLHPAVHAGILHRRDRPEDLAELSAQGMTGIDLIVVNLYPFRETVAVPGVTLGDALENIDIGGPTMIRAAAKNFPDVLVVVDPADYDELLASLQRGPVALEQRRKLAAKAFAHVAAYDSAVAAYLTRDEFPQTLSLAFQKAQSLRYGENPHQAAAFYRDDRDVRGTIAGAHQHQGKELSFTNILDADGALRIVRSFAEPTATIIKHTNPCGLATADDLITAHAAARSGDPVSAFGGIVGFNRPVDETTARALAKYFYEIIVAPAYTPEALAVFSTKANLRVLEVDMERPWEPGRDLRRVSGGLLVQTADDATRDRSDSWRIATTADPTPKQLRALQFAWKACTFVKSNAIVLVQDQTLVGMGAGQPSRVDAVELAVRKAGERAHGSVLASDAFFPKADGVEAAALAGVVAIVQPGGSQGDEETIAAANAHGIAMLFTGTRHFRH